MSQERPSERREPHDLNWFGKTVYYGGTVLRLTANLVDTTVNRVSRIAAESKKEFDRELDPNIEEARVIEEYPDREAASET
jgi:cytidylate kinase